MEKENIDIENLSIINSHLNLSDEQEQKLVNMINNGELILTKNNIKILNSFYNENIISILMSHYSYINLIDQTNFTSLGILKDDDFVNLLRVKKIKVNDDSPFLVKRCANYILEQLKNNEIDNATLLKLFPDFYMYDQYEIIQEYLKKNPNTDLSVFMNRNESNQIEQYFLGISVSLIDNKYVVECESLNNINLILNLTLPYEINSIVVKNECVLDKENLYSLNLIDEKNIDLSIKGGFNFKGDLDSCIEFIKLSGGIGSVELDKFDIESFNQLLEFCKDFTSINLKVSLDDQLENEKYFNCLNTNTKINFYSQKNVTNLSLEEIKNIKKMFENLVSDIKNSNLSPYEKYIYAYNIVKSFKKYKFYENNEKLDEFISDQSRHPYLVMINDFIVCAGYSQLLQRLLLELDIPSVYWIIDTNKETTSHARLYVNIEDEKYGINGYYCCDPTWDMTDDKIKDMYGYKYMNMSVGEVHDYGESSSDFYYFGREHKLFNDEVFINTANYINNAEDINLILEKIIDLDPDFVDYIKNLKNDDDKRKLLIEHISMKTYRAISLQKKYDAIVSVMEFSNNLKYSEEEKKNIKEKLYNIERLGYSYEKEESPIIAISESNDDWIDWIDDDDEIELSTSTKKR